MDVQSILSCERFVVLIVSWDLKMDIEKYITKVPSLQGEKEAYYLISCFYEKPTSIFMYPLFLWRYLSAHYVRVEREDIKRITWHLNGRHWTVHLPNGQRIHGLKTIQPFVIIKHQYTHAKL